MTDTQISQLVQDVINGIENPSKALNLVWPLENTHHNPTWINKCVEQIIKVLNSEAEQTVKARMDLISHSPKLKQPEGRSQWQRVGTADHGTSLESLSTDAQAYYRI